MPPQRRIDGRNRPVRPRTKWACRCECRRETGEHSYQKGEGNRSSAVDKTVDRIAVSPPPARCTGVLKRAWRQLVASGRAGLVARLRFRISKQYRYLIRNDSSVLSWTSVSERANCKSSSTPVRDLSNDTGKRFRAKSSLVWRYCGRRTPCSRYRPGRRSGSTSFVEAERDSSQLTWDARTGLCLRRITIRSPQMMTAELTAAGLRPSPSLK